MFSVPIIENLRDLWARDFCKRRCERFDFFYPSNQPIIKAEGSREDLLAGITVSHMSEPPMTPELKIPVMHQTRACREAPGDTGEKWHE